MLFYLAWHFSRISLRDQGKHTRFTTYCDGNIPLLDEHRSELTDNASSGAINVFLVVLQINPLDTVKILIGDPSNFNLSKICSNLPRKSLYIVAGDWHMPFLGGGSGPVQDIRSSGV